jgi:hypothetical protein
VNSLDAEVPRDNQGETVYCLIRRCSRTSVPLPH